MKIDVQGYDLEVLKGSKKTIIKQKMPIIFEYEEDFAKDFNYSFKSFENFFKRDNICSFIRLIIFINLNFTIIKLLFCNLSHL